MTIHLESIRRSSLENWNSHAIWISMSSKLPTPGQGQVTSLSKLHPSPCCFSLQRLHIYHSTFFPKQWERPPIPHINIDYNPSIPLCSAAYNKPYLFFTLQSVLVPFKQPQLASLLCTVQFRDKAFRASTLLHNKFNT